jgi:hypothetical protein
MCNLFISNMIFKTLFTFNEVLLMKVLKLFSHFWSINLLQRFCVIKTVYYPACSFNVRRIIESVTGDRIPFERWWLPWLFLLDDVELFRDQGLPISVLQVLHNIRVQHLVLTAMLCQAPLNIKLWRGLFWLLRPHHLLLWGLHLCVLLNFAPAR